MRVAIIDRRRPYAAPHAIDRLIAVPREPVAPVVRPLLVDVMSPALPRDRRREEDDRGEPDQAGDKIVGMARLEMLGDLERHGEIKTSLQMDRSGQIVRPKTSRWDLQHGAVDPAAVEPEHIGDAERAPARQPSSDPAADIDDACRLDDGLDDGQDDIGRAP